MIIFDQVRVQFGSSGYHLLFDDVTHFVVACEITDARKNTILLQIMKPII